jgi:FolB domain-containing protein
LMENDRDEDLDKILIKDLLLRCIIGVNEFERREKQDIVVNVTIFSNLTEASKTDDIRKTVDYKQITKDVIKLVERSEFFLVETLAENIAQACLKHEKISKVKVAVDKPGALRFARSVGVEIIRRKDQPKT